GTAADGKTVQERSNVGDLRRHQHERRHASVSTSAEDDRADALAFFVEEHDVGAHQVGAAVIAAARIRTVTERAVDGEECLAAFTRRRIADRALRIGDETTLAAAALAGGLRRQDAEPQREATEHTPGCAMSVHGRSNSSR